MRKLYILTLLFFISIQLKAQAPNLINYQGVARDASGNVLSAQPVSLRFTIHQGSTGGAAVYRETQAVTTNQLGLFSVAIGSGTVVTGTFSTIAWGTNTEYLQVEMDPAGGTSYLDMGTNQFLSVPYALNSGSSSTGWGINGNAGITTSNFLGTTDGNPLIIQTSGAERMRVLSGGNVGIGINAPTVPLHIVQTGNATSDFGTYNTAVEIENKTGTAPFLYLNGSTSNNNLTAIIQRGSTTAFYEGLNNNKDFRLAGISSITATGITNAKDGVGGLTVVNSSGNVGVGIAAPTVPFHVVQTGNLTSDFGTYNTAMEIENKTGTCPFLYINGSTANNKLAGIIQRGNTTAIYEGLNNNADFRIAGITSITATAVSNAKDGVAGLTVLSASGNVGVGIATPSVPLHVVQTGNLTSDFGTYNTAMEIENKSGTCPFLYINGSTANNKLAGIIQRGNTTAFYEGLNNNANFRIAAITAISATAVSNAKDGATGITVLASNNFVGIGTITPAQPLHVVETGNTSSDFGGYNFPVQIESANGTNSGLYINGSTSTNKQAYVVLRSNTTGFMAGLNNNTDYRIAPIAAISATGLTNAKDGTSGLTVLTSNGNVGIQKISPAQALDVAGNVQFSQALMPAGSAGTSGQVLQSNGAGVAPTWVNPAAAGGTAGGVNYGTGAGSGYTPAGAPGQVLQSNGTSAPSWVNVSVLGGSGDNWGSQTASTDSFATAGVENTISGDGSGGSPLRIARQGATTGQVLSWNGTTWAPTTAASSGWSLTGNTAITNPASPATYGSSNFGGTENWIGTTDTRDLVFGTNKVERMRIGGGTVATAGNIGIGTATPVAPIHIVQNGNPFNSDFSSFNVALQIENKGGTMPLLYISGKTANNALAGIAMRGNAQGVYVGLNNSQDLRLCGITTFSSTSAAATALTNAKDGATGITVLTSNGNVGIQKISPAQALDVTGNVQFSAALMPGGSAGTSGQVLQSNGAGAAPTWVTASGGGGGWGLTGNAGTSASTNFIGTTDGVDFVVKTSNAERVRGLSGGNVGIGTNNPAQRLHVVETNNPTSDFGGYNFPVEIESVNGTNSGIYINGSTSNNKQAYVVLRANTTGFMAGLNNNSDYRIAPIASINSTGLTNAKDGTSGITVLTSNSNVGISTITPNSNLQVAGSVSYPLVKTATSLTLTAAHYTVIITGGTPGITLPAAPGISGRIYVIVNQTATPGTISSYVDATGAGNTTIPANTYMTVQSDGTTWNRIQ